MPGLDSTGPMGQGAQTGRKLGKCNNGDDSVVEGMQGGRGFGRRFRNRSNSEPGLGMGRGRGRGRGPGRGAGRKANM